MAVNVTATDTFNFINFSTVLNELFVMFLFIDSCLSSVVLDSISKFSDNHLSILNLLLL